MNKKYCLNMDIELHKELRIRCIEEDITFTALIVRLAESFLERNKVAEEMPDTPEDID